MKARVKSTKEIGEVANIDLLFGNKGYRYQSDEVEIIDSSAEVDADNDTEIDYWERLKHKYAGMAMQGIMNNPIGFENIRARGGNLQKETALLASEFAHALVEKMKEDFENNFEKV